MLMTRLVALVTPLFAVAPLLAGCSGPDTERRAAAPTAAPSQAGGEAGGMSSAPRVITPEQRDAMLAALREDNPSTRKIWFAVLPNNPESTALKNSLEAVFKEAGWESKTQTVSGMRLKPGLFVMSAEEEPPDYIDTVVKALEASGLPLTKGSGYRAYYEEKTRTDPKWVGIALAPDQDYVVVVGPNPPA